MSKFDSCSSSTGSEADVDQLFSTGYMFEPEYSDAQILKMSTPVSVVHEFEQNGQNRLKDNAWCLCGNCLPMDSVYQSVCCKEISKLNIGPKDPCIIEHPGFEAVCLNPWVLQTALFGYRQQYDVGVINSNQHKKYRHLAYRQLVRWHWGYLGKSIRVPLPSCAVTKIRNTFPSTQYKGFVLPVLN